MKGRTKDGARDAAQCHFFPKRFRKDDSRRINQIAMRSSGCGATRSGFAAFVSRNDRIRLGKQKGRRFFHGERVRRLGSQQVLPEPMQTERQRRRRLD
jgi:hypothetical protein